MIERKILLSVILGIVYAGILYLLIPIKPSKEFIIHFVFASSFVSFCLMLFLKPFVAFVVFVSVAVAKSKYLITDNFFIYNFFGIISPLSYIFELVSKSKLIFIFVPLVLCHLVNRKDIKIRRFLILLRDYLVFSLVFSRSFTIYYYDAFKVGLMVFSVLFFLMIFYYFRKEGGFNPFVILYSSVFFKNSNLIFIPLSIGAMEVATPLPFLLFMITVLLFLKKQQMILFLPLLFFTLISKVFKVSVVNAVSTASNVAILFSISKLFFGDILNLIFSYKMILSIFFSVLIFCIVKTLSVHIKNTKIKRVVLAASMFSVFVFQVWKPVWYIAPLVILFPNIATILFNIILSILIISA